METEVTNQDQVNTEVLQNTDEMGIVHQSPTENSQPPSEQYEPENRARGYLDPETGEMKWFNGAEPQAEAEKTTDTPQNTEAESQTETAPTEETQTEAQTESVVNPLLRTVGDKTFDLSKPDDIPLYESALREDALRQDNESKRQAQTQLTNEQAWHDFLGSDPILKNLGVQDAKVIAQQVESGAVPTMLKTLSDQAMNLYRQYNIGEYLNQDGSIKDEYQDDADANAKISTYAQARTWYDNYKQATDYIERMSTIKQANEIVGERIAEMNGKTNDFWKTFAPLSGIPFDEWQKGEASTNPRVVDVVRAVMANNKAWSTYNFYGKPQLVLTRPEAIREAWESRYGKIPIASANGVTANKPPVVHSAAPKSTVVSPTGSNLTIQQMRLAMENPAEFFKMDNDESRDKTVLWGLENNKKTLATQGYQPKLPTHVRRWMEERALSLTK